MKFKCCSTLLHSMNFQPRSLMACGYNYFLDYNGEIFEIEDYRIARDKITEQLKKGEIPEGCQTCGILAEREWDESIGIDMLEITHRYTCKVCDCIYCIATDADPEKKAYYNSLKPYDIRPVIINLRNNNIFLPKCTFAVNGGECAEYPKDELKWLVYLAYKQQAKLSFLSSGIIFSEIIEEALALTDTSIKVSVDAGTKEIYAKIKRVPPKTFDKVWENLEKYIIASEKRNKNGGDSKVFIKYIIIPGINDNIEQAQAFIDKCISINCKFIDVSLEIHWKRSYYNKDGTEGIKAVANFFNQYKKDGVFVYFVPEAQEYLQKLLI